MQGAVDPAFEENGRLVIVDYKTDRVRDIQKLAALYQKQLTLYREAMRQSLEIEVKECLICSIALNDSIRVDI
jgi:ATP-dependent helicase/nuclease subunit A